MGATPSVPSAIRPYLVAPLLVLVAAVPSFRALGALRGGPLASWRGSVRHALALIFCFTASAHFNRQRSSLVRMVPPRLPYPGLLVSVTSGLEVLGAAGLTWPRTAALAGRGLAVLLILLFPANVRAARAGLTIGE